MSTGRRSIFIASLSSELDGFFDHLSQGFRYAVEVRNTGLLVFDYLQVLSNHCVAHGYNHWSYMPPLAEQHKLMECFTTPFMVLRLRTPLKMS